MKRAEILEILAEIVTEVSEGNVCDITEQSNLVKDLELDSIKLVHLQILVEDKFHIHFDPIEDNPEETFETIYSLTNRIENKIRKE